MLRSMPPLSPVRTLAIGCSLVLCVGSAAGQDRFTLGSTSVTVAEVQGRPALVERLRSLGYEV